MRYTRARHKLGGSVDSMACICTRSEVNFGDQRPGLPRAVPNDQSSGTHVVDSATFGVARAYWYGWDLDSLGVDVARGSSVTPAGTAFVTVREWLTGARPAGCLTRDGLRQVRVQGCQRWLVHSCLGHARCGRSQRRGPPNMSPGRDLRTRSQHPR